MPGSSRTLHNHVLFCNVFFFFVFWLQVVIMACREFEMGKVMMFPVIRYVKISLQLSHPRFGVFRFSVWVLRFV